MSDDTGSSGATHNELLWEQSARWWQQTFTGGADPEYEDQVLPLVARHLTGARRVLDIGCGEGQVARCIAGLSADVVGLDPAPTQVREARGAAEDRSTPGRAPKRCHAGRARSTRSWRVSPSSTSRRSTVRCTRSHAFSNRGAGS